MHDHGLTDLRLVASRFRGVADEWALERGEGLGVASETRMRHAIDVAGSARRLLARDERSDVWVRSPNPALFGRSPHEVMIAEPRGLAAIRHRLMSEVADELN